MKRDFHKLDQIISRYMNRWGLPALRFSFAIIYSWFGILKPLGDSPAEPLLKATVAWMPLISPEVWLDLIGWWEVGIGLCFLTKITVRIAISLLFLQMFGTFIPLVFLPEITFQNGNYLMPTMEGQYIIKNLMIISAALVIGGSLYDNRKQPKLLQEE